MKREIFLTTLAGLVLGIHFLILLVGLLAVWMVDWMAIWLGKCCVYEHTSFSLVLTSPIRSFGLIPPRSTSALVCLCALIKYETSS